MKVLLINPTGFSDLSGEGVNVGLGYLASAVMEEGHDVRVLDLNTSLKIPNVVRINKSINWLPEFVGISINSFNVLSAVRLIDKIKPRLPHATFWAGGPHITIVKENFLKQYIELFDGLVIGEGDRTIKEILNTLCGSRLDDINNIPGLICKTKNGEILETSAREFIKDIDSLSFPNYDVFDSYPEVVSNWYNLLTSRGCPNNCVFCSSKMIWRRNWRYRSLTDIENELIAVKNKHGVKKVRIVDDNFSIKKGRAVDILNLLSSYGFNISLTNGIRADSVDDEFAKILRKNRVSPVVIGVENADCDTFEYVQKGESLAQIEYALKILRENHINVIATMVIGLINTNTESVTRSIKFLKKVDASGHWMIALPFPGTALYTWACDNGRMLFDYSQFAAEGITRSMVSFPPPVYFDTVEYPAAQRLEDFKRANLISNNYHFLFNESEPISRIISRIATLVIKYDLKRITTHVLGITYLLLHLLLIKFKRANKQS
jgi:anaerobic magnesium-protoporphyrin IX monomethyl ester cyclase